jgi:cytochrome P450
MGAVGTEPGRLFAAAAPWADMDAWHEQVAAIRHDTAVLPVELDGFQPFWVLTRYADVQAVERDHEHWLNTPRAVLTPEAYEAKARDAGLPPARTLIHLDGKDHKDHRMVTSDWFKPATVQRYQEQIEALADLYIDRMRELGGECDFARDIAQPYTLRVIMSIYGVPESDEPLMMELTQGLFGAADPEYLGGAADAESRMITTVMRFVEYFNGITEDRRTCPTADLASVIANGEPGGCPIGDAERLWYYIIVATAGHDTTSYALSGGMEALLRDPVQLQALRADPDLIVNAVEECIRWTSPVRHFMRYATRATEVAGVAIPEGGRVLLSYPSANRDDAVFTDPMRFDVRRADADRQLSFGFGAHFCLGSQFARRELRVMLTKLVEQLAGIEPAGPAAWSESSFVSGVKHLPIRYAFR